MVKIRRKKLYPAFLFLFSIYGQSEQTNFISKRQAKNVFLSDVERTVTTDELHSSEHLWDSGYLF